MQRLRGDDTVTVDELPVVGEGEPCDEAICGQGTRCEWVVPGGGQCIAYSCLTSHTFGDVDPEPEVEPEL